TVEQILGDGSTRILGTGGYDTLDFRDTVLTGISLIDGGSGNDTIYGSGGDDVITGGSGNDTVCFACDFSDCTFEYDAENNTLIVTDTSGICGVDILTNVEILSFGDLTITIESLLSDLGY
ncbi:MAG: hypothetical protein K8S55_01065, partial [Phycisphaerae bacterium]|nr:hypothetical protein [Phycisphaerae bacterium]